MISKIPVTQSIRSGQRKKMPGWLVLLPFLVIAGCCLPATGLFLFELIPRYVRIPIAPPQDQDLYAEFWTTSTESVISNYPFIHYLSFRHFIHRREGFYSGVIDQSKSERNKEIINYFDDQLSLWGWSRSDYSSPCQDAIPESQFVDDKVKDFVHYHRNGYISAYGFPDDEDDVVYLLIVELPFEPPSSKIILATVKPSPFTWFLTVIDD